METVATADKVYFTKRGEGREGGHELWETIGNLIKGRQAMANSASEIYMRLHHHYSDAPPSSGREKNTEKKGLAKPSDKKISHKRQCSLLIQYHSVYHHVDGSDDGRDRKRIDLKGPAVDLLSFEVKRVKYLDESCQIFIKWVKRTYFCICLFICLKVQRDSMPLYIVTFNCCFIVAFVCLLCDHHNVKTTQHNACSACENISILFPFI